MITECSICKKQSTDKGKTWGKGLARDEPISHGYCPECFAEEMKRLERLLK